MTIEGILKLIGTYGFPTVLSFFLIIRLDFYLKETIKSNRILASTISTEIKEVHLAMRDIRSDLVRK